jgi:hypothetical protein
MTMTNRYDPSKPEHSITCSRLKCSGPDVPVHPAGLHLDQRSEFYDGPDTLLAATSMYVRPSARKIISEAPELTPEVVDLVTYVEFLGRQVAHVRVDADRKVREALVRSESCEHHGEELKELARMLDHRDKAERRAEAGRLAVLGFLQAVDEFTEKFREGYSGFVSPAQVVSALEIASKKAHAAHDRAWK